MQEGSVQDDPGPDDAQYWAVAEQLGCGFWTADERLFNIAQPTLPWVKWVGDLRMEAETSPAT